MDLQIHICSVCAHLQMDLQIHRTKRSLESSGCWTRPLKHSGYQPQITSMCDNQKVMYSGGTSTHQTKEGIRGRNPASKNLLARYLLCMCKFADGLCSVCAHVMGSADMQIYICSVCAHLQMDSAVYAHVHMWSDLQMCTNIYAVYGHIRRAHTYDLHGHGGAGLFKCAHI